MSAHTPGPWLVAPYCVGDELIEVVADYEELPGGTKRAHWIAQCDAGCDFDGDREEALERNAANARLIATAPDLIDSLKEMVEAYSGLDDALGPSMLHKVKRARAAITKATGSVKP